MIKQTLLTVAASVLLLSSPVSAEYTFWYDDDDRKYVLSSLDIGNLVLQGLFAVIFLVLTILAFMVKSRFPSQKSAYVISSISSMLFFLYNAVSIPFVIFVRRQSVDVDMLYKIGLATVFFRLWGIGTLYLAGSLVLHDRAKHFDECLKKGGNIAYAILFTFSGILILIGSLTSILLAIDRQGISAVLTWIVFIAIWGATAVCQFVIAAVNLRKVRNAGKDDKILSIMMKAWSPLALLSMLLGVVFSFFSITLVSDLIQNIIFSVLAAILVYLGMNSKYWDYSGVNMLPSERA